MNRVPLSKRTQYEIEAAFGFTSKKWNNKVTESMTIEGVFDGYTVRYQRTYTGLPGEDGIEDYFHTDHLTGAIAMLESSGVTKPSISTPQNVPQTQQNAPRTQPPPFGQQQWACPIHGAQKIKTGFRGGYECGVTGTQQPSYAFRTWQGKTGDTMYTCDAKSA